MNTIDNTPAHNFNPNTEISTGIASYTKELNELFERIDEFEKENGKDKCFGYAGIPYVLQRAREVGADKIFFVGRNYHGLYEDDDCSFTYWDEESKEFLHDSWTTRFACPHYDYYEMPIPFSWGWEAGMIDKEAYLEHMKGRNISVVEGTEFNTFNPENLIGLRVEVSNGRKWKGTGYLINIKESSYQFATPMFRNHSENFGVSITRTAIVYDPESNSINECNADYLRFIDSEKLLSYYKLWAKNIIKKSTLENITLNPNSSFGSYILNIDYSLETFISRWIEVHPVDYSTASYPLQEERDRKLRELKETKMPELITWVKENTDKTTEEEILALAEHIFNKRYVK